jgi:hypothetical protein
MQLKIIDQTVHLEKYTCPIIIVGKILNICTQSVTNNVTWKEEHGKKHMTTENRGEAYLLHGPY